MRKLIVFFSVLLTISVYSQTEIVPISVGTQLPLADRQMKTTDGGASSLSENVGENGLIVIFSSNTCPFVVGGDGYSGWEKDYNTLYETAKKNGIALVLVNSNEAKRDNGESMDDLKKQSADKGYVMKHFYDANSELANAFNAKTTPHVYMFDKNKSLVYEGSIDNTWDAKRKKDEAYLVNAIESLAKGKKINPNQTPAKGCSIKRK
jgi:thioredoxin-related protein